MRQVIEKYTCDKCGCDLNSNGINWKQPSTWKRPEQGRFHVTFNVLEGGSRPDLCALCAATLLKEFSEAALAYALEPSL